MVCSVAPDWKGIAGPIGPAVNEETLVKWSVLSRQIVTMLLAQSEKECISPVGLSLLNVIHHTVM
jgi:hypothetical protein